MHHSGLKILLKFRRKMTDFRKFSQHVENSGENDPKIEFMIERLKKRMDAVKTSQKGVLVQGKEC